MFRQPKLRQRSQGPAILTTKAGEAIGEGDHAPAIRRTAKMPGRKSRVNNLDRESIARSAGKGLERRAITEPRSTLLAAKEASAQTRMVSRRIPRARLVRRGSNSGTFLAREMGFRGSFKSAYANWWCEAIGDRHKKNDFRHRIAHCLDNVATTCMGGDGKNIGSCIERWKWPSPDYLSKAFLSACPLMTIS